MLLEPSQFGVESEVKTYFDSSHVGMQWYFGASPPGQSESSDYFGNHRIILDYDTK